MERRIVQVTPIDRYFPIVWNLTVRCNYDCMYCPTHLHNATDKHHSLETLKQAWINMHEKTHQTELPYKILFTGGEVTSSKYFLPFVKWLRNNYSDRIFQILITTNGSATTSYYKKIFEYIDNISFSLHSEHIDEQKFFDMLVELKSTISKDKFVHVNIMNEFWNTDRIPHYVEILKTHQISHSINEIDYNFQTRTHPIHKGKLNLAI